MTENKGLLTINEWLDALGIDRAYKKDMKGSYDKDKPALKAQLTKIREVVEGAGLSNKKIQEATGWGINLCGDDLAICKLSCEAQLQAILKALGKED